MTLVTDLARQVTALHEQVNASHAKDEQLPPSWLTAWANLVQASRSMPALVSAIRCSNSTADTLQAVAVFSAATDEALKEDQQLEEWKDQKYAVTVLKRRLTVLNALVQHLPPNPALSSTVALTISCADGVDGEELADIIKRTLVARNIHFTEVTDNSQLKDACFALQIRIEGWAYRQVRKNNLGIGDNGAEAASTLTVGFGDRIAETSHGENPDKPRIFSFKSVWREQRLGEDWSKYSADFPKQLDTPESFVSSWLNEVFAALPQLPSCVNRLESWANVVCPLCGHPSILIGDLEPCPSCKANPITGISAWQERGGCLAAAVLNLGVLVMSIAGALAIIGSMQQSANPQFDFATYYLPMQLFGSVGFVIAVLGFALRLKARGAKRSRLQKLRFPERVKENTDRAKKAGIRTNLSDLAGVAEIMSQRTLFR